MQRKGFVSFNGSEKMGRYRLKVVLLLALVLAALVVVGLLYVESDGHIVDYLIWRWVSAFERHIKPVDDYRVIVFKSRHQLEVYHRDDLIARYPIGLSHRLAPRKIWADMLTPEGEFLVASMQYQSVFGPRQMLLETTAQALADYLEEHGKEGQSRLTAWEAQHGPLDTIWEVYDFNEAHTQQPIWNDILIHGGGSDRDWTLGCIALDDADIVELFDILHQSRRRGLGVIVEIRP